MRALTITLLALALPLTAAADDVAVTVYNGNLGVVSETRTLDFDEGTGRLAFRDVPSGIDAASVRFELVDPGREVAILEQNYAFDLVSPDRMYSRYIDQPIELIDQDGRMYDGTLLAYNAGAVTLATPDGRVKIVLLENIAEVSFPKLPEGLITRPTLFWLYHSDFAGQAACRVGYQTSGLNWSAEYVGLISDDDSRLDLSGWASINNTSGKTYDNAKLKLIAGEISRAAPPAPRFRGAKGMEMMAADAAAGFEEKAFFEYHMYTLPRQATLADREIKQISLFEPAGTPVEKVYTYRPDGRNTSVEVTVKFTNSAKTGLGMPLPEGRVRVFKQDDDGAVILLGEDRIKHTPRDEEVTLKIGNAFDIVGEERLVDQTMVSKTVEDRDFEFEIRNRKEEAVTVRIEKRLWGFWRVLSASDPHEIKDATTLVFEVPVAAGQTKVVSCRIRFENR